jgi:hypothetical protein
MAIIKVSNVKSNLPSMIRVSASGNVKVIKIKK